MAKTQRSRPIPRPQKSNRLPEAIKFLMGAHDLNGKRLSKLIGISPTSLSKIMQGKTQPRPETFKKLRKHLCKTAVEISFFEEYHYPRWDCISPSPEPTEALEKKIFHQARLENAQRARLADQHARMTKDLEELGVTFKRDYVLGDLYIDKLIDLRLVYEANGSEQDNYIEGRITVDYQVALLCHPDLMIDLKKTKAFAKYLRETSLFEEVIIVVPWTLDTPYRYKPKGFNPILNEKGLIARLEALKAHAAS